jgi:branched-chain amino acid transport system ATP-binding protein
MNQNRDVVLALEHLATYRGRVQILWDVSLDVRRGETVAVVGPDGAGKTTLLGSIVGLYPPRAGTFRFLGKDVTGESPETMARRRVAVVPERRQLFGPLSVRENLLLGAYARAANVPSSRKRSTRCSRSFRRCADCSERRRARSRAASNRWSRSAAR